MKILFIDDNYREAHEMAETLRSVVPSINFDSHIATTVEDAFHAVGRSKYDAVIIDVMLPPGYDEEPAGLSTGAWFLEKLKHKTPETKLVIYSHFVDPPRDAELRSQILGADFFFKKPVAKNVIGESLAEALKEFLPTEPKPDEKPNPSLIPPVRKSIVTVNTRLAEIFRREPRLLRTIDPIKFEELVAELYEEDGYRVVLTPPRADGGKDIYVYKTDEKLSASFLVECKRYVPPNKVGVEIVRQLYGVVQHERRSGGIIVTTSYFTSGAKDFAGTVPYQLFLRDFSDLEKWLNKPVAGESRGTGDASEPRSGRSGWTIRPPFPPLPP